MTGSTIQVNPQTTSNYSVTYNLGGCIPASNSGTITVNPAPAIVVNNENICIGDDATLTTVPLSGQQGGVYAWDSGQNTSSILLHQIQQVYTL